MQIIETAYASAEGAHSGPHIPALMGDPTGFSFFGIPVTTTILSTWIFMVFLFIIVAFFYRASKAKKANTLQAVGIDLIKRIDVFFGELLGSCEISRKFIWLVGGFFIFIFLGNIFGLILDVIGLVSPITLKYIRPINSDMNTTLVMSLTIILVAQGTAVFVKGAIKHFGHYIFNFHGESTAEKFVSVFVSWLHFIGEFIRIGSLSLRLYLNIFVGIVIISVATYLGSMIPLFGLGKFLTLPFWFFEILVAFLQAYIFMTLSGLYLKEAVEESH